MSKVKIETVVVAKWASLKGHSFVFPFGCKVFVQRHIKDVTNGTEAYQGMVFKNGTVIEVQFGGPDLAVKGFDQSPNVTLDVASIGVC